MKYTALLFLTTLTLTLGACPTGDDDDDEADCEGTLDATFNGSTFSGTAGQVCATHQGTQMLIYAKDEALDADLNIHIEVIEDSGTYNVAEFSNYSMTGHIDGVSYSATTGTLTFDSWSDPDLSGSFDVEGLSADSTLPFDADGTFDVVSRPPED